ncbi:MAG: hypothetical protein ACK58T_42975, partial [Phycisphaerae bacterium]
MQSARKCFAALQRAETAEQAERIVCGLASSFGGSGKLFRWWHRHVQQHRNTKPEQLIPFIKAMMQFEILQDRKRAYVEDFLATPAGRV